MKPIDIYNKKTFDEKKEIYTLEKHITEVNWSDVNYSLNEKISIRHYVDYCFDGRRVWELFSVWFDGTPVMICEQAGREGDDHVQEYITNVSAYKDMCAYIESLRETEEIEQMPISYGETEEIESLGVFYNFEFEDFYNENLQPLHKVGDVVIADVVDERDIGGYVFDDTRKSKRKVVITNVYPLNRYHTYTGYEVEREQIGDYNWRSQEDTREIVSVQGERKGKKIYVHLGFDLVQIG